MAPMTRNRAIGNIPNTLMAEYYAQRAAVRRALSQARPERWPEWRAIGKSAA
jgi:hypothetical protein